MRAAVNERTSRTERWAKLATRDDGTMRLVAVADTHGKPHPRAAERIRALAPDAILHGGDVGDLEVLAALAEVAPVLAVRGNIDGKIAELPDLLTIDVRRGETSALTNPPRPHRGLRAAPPRRRRQARP